MNKKEIIDRINKEFDKSGILSNVFTDCICRNIHTIRCMIDNLFDDMSNNGEGMYDLVMGDTRYEGVPGELGHMKIYTFTIIDGDTDEEIIYGNFVCNFCGHSESPMDGYMISVHMM